jgi:hypothetical protein
MGVPSEVIHKHFLNSKGNKTMFENCKLSKRVSVQSWAYLPYSLYMWKFNFGQSIWDNSVVLLGTSWATQWELGKPFDNFMGTHLEKQKIPLTPLKVS